MWRALRDRAHHDVWIDQRVVPAQDWWATILKEIEDCETFVYVMSPKAVESIYCTAEVEYAAELNKPILPLMLKPCDYPAELSRRRIQYQTLSDDMSLGDVLFTIERGVGEIRVAILQGAYELPEELPPRPDEPKPEQTPEQVSEVFMMAEEAAHENNLSLAEKLFQQVMEADPESWGLAAAERLGEIRFEHKRNAHYLSIVQMASNPARLKGTRAAWRGFVQKYGTDYDPNDLNPLLSVAASSQPTPPSSVSVSDSPPQSDVADVQPTGKQTAKRPPKKKSAQPQRPRVIEILPPPFEWCEISAGEVTLEAGGYVPEGGQTFKVDEFLMAKYPVTNAQFAKFVEADGYSNREWWTDFGWKQREKNSWSEPRHWQKEKWNGVDYPVVGVSWYEAVALCLWLSDVTGENINLPTEQQWQRAAQGYMGWAYPWGNDFDKERCNTGALMSLFSGRTTPVTQYEGKGDSPFKVVDMSGNVNEWRRTDYDGGSQDINIDVTRRVLRGGSGNNFRTFARAVARARHAPGNRNLDNGFRVVRPPSL